MFLNRSFSRDCLQNCCGLFVVESILSIYSVPKLIIQSCWNQRGPSSQQGNMSHNGIFFSPVSTFQPKLKGSGEGIFPITLSGDPTLLWAFPGSYLVWCEWVTLVLLGIGGHCRSQAEDGWPGSCCSARKLTFDFQLKGKSVSKA